MASINTGLVFATILLLSTKIWAQTPNQPLVPANKGGVAGYSNAVVLDPVVVDVVGDVISIKFYTINSIEYAVFATSTGVVFIPSSSFDSKSGHIFIPGNTMQGDLADFIVRTDLSSPELHILSTQVKGETLARFNLSAIFQGESDRTAFLGEPRHIISDLVGDLSLSYNPADGYTYISDIDGNILRFASRDPAVTSEEELYQHGCKGSASVQFNLAQNRIYFACPDAKVSIITINPSKFNASEESSLPLEDPLTTVSILLSVEREMLIIVTQTVEDTAVVTFSNISEGQWSPSTKKIVLRTDGAAISAATMDPRGLLYVAQKPLNDTQQSALHQIDVPNWNYEALLPLDPSEAAEVNLLAFSSTSQSIYFGTLDITAKLVLSKWTGAAACEANCYGNGVCTPARTCICSDSSQYSQPWCERVIIGPVSAAPQTASPVAANAPEQEPQAPVAEASPEAEKAPQQPEPPVEAKTPVLHVPVANVTSPLANVTSPESDVPSGPNMGLVVLGILMGLIAIAGFVAFLVNIYVQKQEQRRGDRLRDLEASSSDRSKTLSAERTRLLSDM